MKSFEPVRQRGRHNRRAVRLGAVVAMAAALVLAGGALTATASPAPSTSLSHNLPSHTSTPKVSLKFASPTSGATMFGTADIALTGKNLAKVKIYRLAKQVGTAVVSADGLSATAQIDTTAFRDGYTTLTAIGWGASAKWPTALAGPIVVKIKNAHSDYALPGYGLLFNDEFSGTELDRSVWCTRYMWEGGTEGPDVWNAADPDCTKPFPGSTEKVYGTLDTLGGDGSSPGQEQEVYRDYNNQGEKLHVVSNGYLALNATATRLDQPNLKYESSMIRAKQEFQPTAGHPLYLTARVKMPGVKGAWPAFWLAGGLGEGDVNPNWPPEIDVLEAPLNVQDDRADFIHFGTITYGSDQNPPPQGTQDWFDVSPRFDTQFGNYQNPGGVSIRNKWVELALEWGTDYICWYVDGYKAVCQDYTWVANEGPEATNPAAVLLNLAVGGPWAGRYGVDDASFPISYDIDHVRIYSK